MASIPWLLFTERLVGKGHPSLSDTTNRALRQVLTDLGLNPDADPAPFIGKLAFVAHHDTNYANGDASAGGQLNVYSQIMAVGPVGGNGADTQIVAVKHRSGGPDFDIHLVPEKVNGVLGTGVVFIDTDIKVADYLQAPFRGHGLRITQSDNSAFIEFPISGGIGDLYGKLRGGNGGNLSFIVRIGSASGFFVIENAAGIGKFTVDDNGLARAISAVYSGVGTLTSPVATQYRVPAVLFQSGNFNTTSTSDASITSFNLLGGTLGTALSAVRIRAGGRQVTQNGSFNIKFGASVLFTLVPLAGENWWVDLKVTRVGASAERLTGITVHNATVAALSGTPGETLSGDILIDFRGSVTAGGTLNLDDCSIEYLSQI